MAMIRIFFFFVFYYFRIKVMFGSCLQLFVGGPMCYIRYLLCLLADNGVQHKLCYVMFCLDSSSVPNIASFSGLSIFDCSFGIL